MAKSIREALEEAQRKGGVTLRLAPKPSPTQSPRPAKRPPQVAPHQQDCNQHKRQRQAKKKAKPKQQLKSIPSKMQPGLPVKLNAQGQVVVPVPSLSRQRPRAPTSAPTPPAVRIHYLEEATLAWKPDLVREGKLLEHDARLGARKTLYAGAGGDRELVLGVDFGTSSTKVVIGDRTMKTAYAVPFLDTVGVGAYLLPSRLGSSNGVFSLDKAPVTYRDLKLGMLAEPGNEDRCICVCAYLALVIRAARSWLFTRYASQYQRASLLWSLALGQPADQSTSSRSRGLFERLAQAAWALAEEPGEIDEDVSRRTWRAVNAGRRDADLEVLVMPELAAQIHGFISSTHFDSKAANIYLMADVGAGTVDASVFRVHRTSTGGVGFEFFTNTVEAHGVMNLHRFRVDWWRSNLGKDSKGEKAKRELEGMRLPTEFSGYPPDSYKSYIAGTEISFVGGEQSPDELYFKKRVSVQVKGNALCKAWSGKLLPQGSITGMPFFLCGGGARHAIYAQLKNDLLRQDGATWLSAQHRELILPTNLVAPGVVRMDYDRLSVAYGLSQLSLDSVTRALTMRPRAPLQSVTTWQDSYISKDQC